MSKLNVLILNLLARGPAISWRAAGVLAAAVVLVSFAAAAGSWALSLRHAALTARDELTAVRATLRAPRPSVDEPGQAAGGAGPLAPAIDPRRLERACAAGADVQ